MSLEFYQTTKNDDVSVVSLSPLCGSAEAWKGLVEEASVPEVAGPRSPSPSIHLTFKTWSFFL